MIILDNTRFVQVFQRNIPTKHQQELLY